MRLLIDGDISRYELGAVCQSVEMHFGQPVARPHSEQKVREVVDRFVNGIVDRTDSDGFELFLSGGTNYRNAIAVTHPYKGQRHAPKPYHWATVGDILREDYGAYTVHGAEADDVLSIFGRMDPDNTIIGSRDKDLRIVPCYHYSWACGKTQPEVPVHRVERLGWVAAKAYNSGGYKLVGEGLKFFYGQVLAGDAIDNYKGCPGCGPQKAANALANCSSEYELFQAAHWIYTAKLGPEKGLQLLIENARLAWLLDDAEVTYDANDIHVSPKRLWEPPPSIPDGEPERPVPVSTMLEPADDPSSGSDWSPPWCDRTSAT
ncbi:DNA polymerase I [compost metagenome]